MLETLIQSLGLILIGFFAALGGGEILVRGAVHFAKMLRVSALLISLTIVALGTSAPELAITMQSVRGGMYEMALGNILGSCLFNIMFILGICAVIAPLEIRKRMLAFDLPMMVIAALLLYFYATNDGNVSRQEGSIMLFLLAIFLTGRFFFDRFAERRQLARLIQSNKGIAGESVVTYENTSGEKFSLKNLLLDIIFIAAGLGLLVLGADWLVKGSVEICKIFGVSELVIGLTVLAIGSSLPEIMVSVMATIKGEKDVAVGNIVGSNTMNILCVLALTVIIMNGIPVSQNVQMYDLRLVVLISLVCVPIFVSSRFISRGEGVFFLVCYVAYSLFLYYKETQSPYLEQISWILGISLAVLLGMALGVEAWLRRKKQKLEKSE
ncbi:MAG: calcium/sodium antiporter [Planctomycetia bacterium]|nr:calcium/sodium antiporter [Planctomycetia bacterium]